MVTHKLRPLGLLTPRQPGDANAAGSGAEAPVATPLLILRARGVLFPAQVVNLIADALRPLFLPPVVGAVLTGLLIFDGWLFGAHGVGSSVKDVLGGPTLLLAVLGLVLASMIFHEFGHAAGCGYGGARPGVIGVGLYLLWPAFYTNVTDAYRLNRVGRLRTDLGGIYFNTIFILGLGGLYALTGYPPLLVAALVTHMEIFQQLLPVIRLDGYFILGDLVGVPDLFGRVRPLLRGLSSRRPHDPRVGNLRPRVRFVITAWALIVIPLLAVNLVLLLAHAPSIVRTAARAVSGQVSLASAALGGGNVAMALLAGTATIALAIPVLGMGLMFARLGVRGTRQAVRWSRGRPVRLTLTAVGAVSAAALLVLSWQLQGELTVVPSAGPAPPRPAVPAQAALPVFSLRGPADSLGGPAGGRADGPSSTTGTPAEAARLASADDPGALWRLTTSTAVSGDEQCRRLTTPPRPADSGWNGTTFPSTRNSPMPTGVARCIWPVGAGVPARPGTEEAATSWPATWPSR